MKRSETLSWTLDSEGFHTGGQRGRVYSESMGGAVFPRDAPVGRLESKNQIAALQCLHFLCRAEA